MGHYSSPGIKARSQVRAKSPDKSPAAMGIAKNRTFRLAVALAMLASMMLPPAGHSAAHFTGVAGACDTERQAHAAREHPGHEHLHDHLWICDGDGAPLSGHNPADHTHDVPAAPLGQPLPSVRVGGLPVAVPPDGFFRAPSFRIDRPPRPAALT